MGWSRFGEIVFMTFFFWIAVTGLFWVVTLPLSGWPEGIAVGAAFGTGAAVIFGLFLFVGQLRQDRRDLTTRPCRAELMQGWGRGVGPSVVRAGEASRRAGSMQGWGRGVGRMVLGGVRVG